MNHLVAAVEKAAEKVALRKENIALRLQLSPTIKRRMVKLGFFVLLIGVAAVVGTLIGGGSQVQERPRAEIPVGAIDEPANSQPAAQPDSGQ